MRVPCNLRLLRGDRTLSVISAASGVNQGELSRIEHGIALPKDRDVQALENAYGARVEDWYSPRVLLAIESDGDEQDSLRARLRVPHATGFRCPEGDTIFVWHSNQADKNCAICGKPLVEHLP